MSTLARLFGSEPRVTASAPGRVNLLGEHTDYNDGLVLPLAIPRSVHVELAPSPDGVHRFHSVQLGTTVAYADGSAPPPGFAVYLHGCIEVLRQRRHAVPALLASIDSTVPIGAGLSSSAALEVAMLRALCALLSLDLDDEAIAKLGHEAENRYAGVQCGILDQMASSFATTDHMLFLDTRTLARKLLPLPRDAALLIVDSGQSRSLAASGYNQRRAECAQAAALLDLASLRDLDAAMVARLPPPLDRRARHVFTENARVRAAAGGLDAAAFGALMNASHASLSADYEVSTPVLDALAAALQSDPDVFGAKLTGAGFGGACVALARSGCTSRVAARIMRSFGASHPGSTILITG